MTSACAEVRNSVLRTVIVDDSALARLLLRDALSLIPGVRVIGNASQGYAAIDVISVCRPDLVTLDVEMPGMSGLDVLREIKRLQPQTHVLMCSRKAGPNSDIANESKASGAMGYISKPTSRNRDQNVIWLRDQIATQIQSLLVECFGGDPPPVLPFVGFDLRSAAGSLPLVETSVSSLATHVAIVPESDVKSPSGVSETPAVDSVWIGSSTGGPAALRTLLAGLGDHLPVPIGIVQHIPSGFSRPLADRLSQSCTIPVVEAQPDMPLRPGFVYLAKGGYHLLIDGSGENPKLLLTETELEHGCRPAIDVTLRSVHQFYGGRVLVVILTGMGRDGAEGAALIRHSGGLVFVQNPDSSTVSSMPRQAIETAGADRIGELEELGQWINQTVSRNARVR